MKDAKDMKLGEIVGAIVGLAIDSNNSLNGLGSVESPYHTEGELKRGIIENYQTKVGP